MKCECGGEWTIRCADCGKPAFPGKGGVEPAPAGTLHLLDKALAFLEGACAASGQMRPCWANRARRIVEAEKGE